MKWAIIGCGNISNKFSENLVSVKNTEISCIASKNINRLKIFGDKLYESYVVKPGKYKLILELENGESFSEIISVREDPLKTSN